MIGSNKRQDNCWSSAQAMSTWDLGLDVARMPPSCLARRRICLFPKAEIQRQTAARSSKINSKTLYSMIQSQGNSDQASSMGVKRPHAAMAEQETTASASLSPIMSMFEGFRAELDEHHDRRERIIKASRDITASSKKM